MKSRRRQHVHFDSSALKSTERVLMVVIAVETPTGGSRVKGVALN